MFEKKGGYIDSRWLRRLNNLVRIITILKTVKCIMFDNTSGYIESRVVELPPVEDISASFHDDHMFQGKLELKA